MREDIRELLLVQVDSIPSDQSTPTYFVTGPHPTAIEPFGLQTHDQLNPVGQDDVVVVVVVVGGGGGGGLLCC